MEYSYMLCFIFGITWAFIFDMFVYAALAFGIGVAIQALTATTPKTPSSKKPDPFEVPNIEEGKPIAVVFGTPRRVQGSSIAWWGDVDVTPIWESTKVPSGPFNTKRVWYITGYRYKVGVWFIVCHGPIDGIKQIWVGQRVLWPNIDDPEEVGGDNVTTWPIDQPNFFGGESSQGGVRGTIRARYGWLGQTLPTYIQGELGSQVSNARGLTSIFLEQIEIGKSPYMTPWGFLCKRTDILDSGAPQWYPEAADIDGDLNPVHIIRECFTNLRWGLGHSTSLFDDTLWKSVADTLHDEESFGLSRLWEDENETIEDLVTDILRHINAVLYQDPDSGEFVIKLIRDDYVIDDLTEFDESDIIELYDFERPSLGEVPNVFKLDYTDIYSNKARSVVDHDIALINQQDGKRIPVKYDFMAVTKDSLAKEIIARERRAVTALPVTMSLKCKRTMAHLRPGDVFKLVAPSHNIVQMIVRVLPDARYGTLLDGTVSFKVSEDVFSVEESIIGNQGTAWEEPFGAVASADSIIIESPFYWLVNLLGESVALALDEDAGFVLLAAEDPDNSMGYELLVRNDISSSFVSEGTYGFALVGTLQTDLPANADDVELVFEENLQDVGVGTFAIIGNEILKVKDVSTDSSGVETITLARGCLDTVPETHTGEISAVAGDHVWFVDSTLWYSSSTALSYGDQPGTKILTQTGSSQLDEDAAPIDNADVFDARQIRPYPPGNVKINGLSYPTTQLSLPTNGDLEITWSHRDRTQQTDDITEHNEGDIGPETNVTYVIEIYNDSDELVRTSSGITGTSFTYTLAMRLEDGDTANPLDNIRVVLYSQKSGVTSSAADSSGVIDSWQKYDIPVLVGEEGGNGNGNGNGGPVWGTLENYNNYTEVDPGDDITVATNTLSITQLDTRNTDSYVYDDKGIGHFSGDFEHRFELDRGSSSDIAWTSIWTLSNSVDDIKGLADAGEDFVTLTLYDYGSDLTLRIYENGSEVDSDIYEPVIQGTRYYITIGRDDDGGANNTGQYTCYLCTGNYYGESGSSTVATLTADCSAGEQNDFRYIFQVNTFNTGTANKMFNGDPGLLNLDLGEA